MPDLDSLSAQPRRREQESPRARILVVDDDEEIRGIVSRILRDRYDVQTAKTGQEALLRLRERRENLMILDIRMPGIGGMDVLRAVRKVYPELRVLMLTGVADMAVVKKALDGGVHAYMTKPFEFEELRNAVTLLLDPGRPGPEGGRPWRTAS